MLIESDDLVAAFDLQIALCCHQRNPATLCFDCRQLQKTIDTIKKYANAEQIRLALIRRNSIVEGDRPWGFPPFGACPIGAMPE